MHANGLLGSGHVELSDQSAVKKRLTMARSANIKFRLDQLCVLITVAVIVTVCLSEKLGKIHALLSNSA